MYNLTCNITGKQIAIVEAGSISGARRLYYMKTGETNYTVKKAKKTQTLKRR